MAGWDDVSTSSAPQAPQTSDPWDSVSTSAAPQPKLPDMKPIQAMAKDNLAANDNKATEGEQQAEQKPLTASQQLDKAVGVSFKGSNPEETFPAPLRKQLTSSYANGTAHSAIDFMQSAYHSVASILANEINVAAHPIDTMQEGASDVVSAFKGGAGQIMYPFLSPENKETLLENEQLTPYKNEDSPTFQEQHRRALELESATVGKGMGGLFAPFAVLSPILSPVIQTTGGRPLKEDELPTAESNIPGDISAFMDVLGAAGIVHGAGELSALRRTRAAGPMPASGTGAWDINPGANIMKTAVGDAIGKPANQVTSQDIDNHIAEAFKDKAPAAQDFKAVAAITGTNEKVLHNVYNETGIKPDQVYEDLQRNPDIAQDIAQGKIPEAYDHLREQPRINAEETEGLQVSSDESTRSFSVTDKEGDFVSGGFNSAEEAKDFIEERKFEAIIREHEEWERAKGVASGGKELPTEKTTAGEQTVIPGAERISDRELAERKMEGAKQPEVTQKPANEGLFDVAGRKQMDLFEQPTRVEEVAPKEIAPEKIKPSVIPPAERGKPTSLGTFLRNNGAKFDQNGELTYIRHGGRDRWGDAGLDYAAELSHQAGYFPERPLINDLQNTLRDTDGGREHYRDADQSRILDAEQKAEEKKLNDPSYIAHEAHNAGIDTERLAGETDKQYAKRLVKALREFYENKEGAVPINAYRRVLGEVINAAEKFVGKLGGGLFEKFGEGYMKTFAPELAGDKALRADAYLAKYKTAKQEAENAYYRLLEKRVARFDKMPHEDQISWWDDRENGMLPHDDVDGQIVKSLLDNTFKLEKEATGGDLDQGYKQNYLPLQFEDWEGVRKYFNNDPAMIKKYGKDWFTNGRSFDLAQDARRAGFKLKTDNVMRATLHRVLAGTDMVRTMDLLRDMESSGLAKHATAFSVDKRIDKIQSQIAEAEEKFKAAHEKINNPKQENMEFAIPKISKYMETVGKRLDSLRSKLEDLQKEKSENKIPSDQMKELKRNGFRVLGPDNHVWHIDQQVSPLWHNAMESKGLWENQGAMGSMYRGAMQAKNIWTAMKLGLSLFHPVHVMMINLASDAAHAAEHLIHGGNISELSATESTLKGLGRTALGKDHPYIEAWNTPFEERTPEQQQIVTRMVEGGFKPTMSARDTVHFKENFDKAIKGIGLNNLRLFVTAASLPGLIAKPFFEHWIPGMKSELYKVRTDAALARDPSLISDAGRRGEAFRQITKDIDRTYGEMNQDVQFWNKTVRDAFNASFISGGWKLAQIYNARGLLQPAKIAYKWAKTGEFSKDDVTYNMLHAYAYTGLTLALGGLINYALGNPIGTAKDTVWDIVKNLVAPQTGEKNPDGTPVRLNQPAFAKEAYNLAHEINTKGIIGGTNSFLYHQTLLPGIVDTLNNQDFFGHTLITNPLDLNQWMNAGWDTISPISISQYEKSEAKGSEIGKFAGMLGFPTAGAYINQTPFEQKVIYEYDKLNPPKEDAYSTKLKIELKQAVAQKDNEKVSELKHEMKEEGMTDAQIANASKQYTKKFVDTAWKKLPPQTQKLLIDSASEEEKKKFKVRGE